MSHGVGLIATERQRQIDAEGYDATHDVQHTDGSLARAAAAYALQGSSPDLRIQDAAAWLWPWNRNEYNPAPDPIRNLVRAGALIAAEIDRLYAAGEEGGPR